MPKKAVSTQDLTFAGMVVQMLPISSILPEVKQTLIKDPERLQNLLKKVLCGEDGLPRGFDTTARWGTIPCTPIDCAEVNITEVTLAFKLRYDGGFRYGTPIFTPVLTLRDIYDHSTSASVDHGDGWTLAELGLEMPKLDPATLLDDEVSLPELQSSVEQSMLGKIYTSFRDGRVSVEYVNDGLVDFSLSFTINGRTFDTRLSRD